MSILHGSKVQIRDASEDAALIALSTNCEVNVSADTIETAGATDGKFRSFVGGRIEWSVTISAFISAIGTGIDMMGQTYEISFYDTENSVAYTGYAVCTEYKVSATVHDVVKGSFGFQGTGVLEQTV